MGDNPILAYLRSRFPLLARLIEERPGFLWMATAIGMLALFGGVYLVSLTQTKGYTFLDGAYIGGDFIVFWSAAKAAITGAATEIYHYDTLQEAFRTHLGATEEVRVSWQYPPTVYFLLAPFGAVPYLPAFALWATLNIGIFYLILKNLRPHPRALIIAFGSSAVIQGLITGQTGFVTAGLLCAAAALAGPRPILAGIAAGILTIKPQFGLLIPIAFLAGGHWRAFIAAGATTLILGSASVGVFGVESWQAFFEAVSTHSERLQTSFFPYHKVISPYGGMKMLAAPNALAFAVHGLFMIAFAAAIFVIWRKKPDADIRIMTLCALSPLVTPYAFYYELPVILIALFVLAKRGSEKGWLRYERALLPVLWIAPLAVTSFTSIPGVPVASVATLTAAGLVLRRCAHELAFARPAFLTRAGVSS